MAFAIWQLSGGSRHYRNGRARPHNPFVINARNSPDVKRGATVLAELPDDLISVTQGAKLAKMHVSALWRWAMKGKIAHWRRGSRVFVRRSDVIGLFKHNPKGAP